MRAATTTTRITQTVIDLQRASPRSLLSGSVGSFRGRPTRTLARARAARQARLRGPAHVRRHPVHAGSARARRRRRRDHRRTHRRSRLGSSRDALRPAGDPCCRVPAGATPRGRDRRVRRAQGRGLRRRAGAARPIPRARMRAIAGDWCGEAVAAGALPIVLGGDHSITEAGRESGARSSTAPSVWCTSTRTPIPAPRCSASSASHGTPMYRLVEQAARRSGPVRPDRPARLLAGRERVLLAVGARHHERLHARRARPWDRRSRHDGACSSRCPGRSS